MNNFIYAMKKSFEIMQDEVRSILDGTVFSEEEKNKTFYAVGTCLHWILDYAERVNKSENIKLCSKEKALISAFRFANNGLKHGIEIKELTESEGGFTFPMQFPLCIPEKQLVWKVEWNYDERNEKQANHYKTYLDGKNVMESCREMIEILEKYSI